MIAVRSDPRWTGLPGSASWTPRVWNYGPICFAIAHHTPRSVRREEQVLRDLLRVEASTWHRGLQPHDMNNTGAHGGYWILAQVQWPAELSQRVPIGNFGGNCDRPPSSRLEAKFDQTSRFFAGPRIDQNRAIRLKNLGRFSALMGWYNDPGFQEWSNAFAELKSIDWRRHTLRGRIQPIALEKIRII